MIFSSLLWRAVAWNSLMGWTENRIFGLLVCWLIPFGQFWIIFGSTIDTDLLDFICHWIQTSKPLFAKVYQSLMSTRQQVSLFVASRDCLFQECKTFLYWILSFNCITFLRVTRSIDFFVINYSLAWHFISKSMKNSISEILKIPFTICCKIIDRFTCIQRLYQESKIDLAYMYSMVPRW